MRVPSVSPSVPSSEESETCRSLFATTGTLGVVDLGASQTVVGSAQVPELLSHRDRTRRCPCQLTFRFGNHQTLVSKHALVLPLGQQSFPIAVAEGKTPFLIPNAFLKGLRAILDTDKETQFSKTLNRYLALQKSNKNLFLMDLNQLWETDNSAEISYACDISCHPDRPLSEKKPCLPEAEVTPKSQATDQRKGDDVNVVGKCSSVHIDPNGEAVESVASASGQSDQIPQQ